MRQYYNNQERPSSPRRERWNHQSNQTRHNTTIHITIWLIPDRTYHPQTSHRQTPIHWTTMRWQLPYPFQKRWTPRFQTRPENTQRKTTITQTDCGMSPSFQQQSRTPHSILLSTHANTTKLKSSSVKPKQNTTCQNTYMPALSVLIHQHCSE